MANLQCPRCRSTLLSTVEKLVGFAHCKIDSSTHQIVWEGQTTVDFDHSVTETHHTLGTLVACRACGWEWYPRVLRRKSADVHDIRLLQTQAG